MVPTPTLIISFSLKAIWLRESFGFGNLPRTLKNVTKPVAPTVPIPWDIISLAELIPILYVLLPRPEAVVDIPET